MLGSNAKVFRYDYGEVDWVVAESREQADAHMFELFGEDASFYEEIKELTVEDLKDTSYRDDNFSGTMYQQYIRSLLMEGSLPYTLAATE